MTDTYGLCNNIIYKEIPKMITFSEDRVRSKKGIAVTQNIIGKYVKNWISELSLSKYVKHLKYFSSFPNKL